MRRVAPYASVAVQTRLIRIPRQWTRRRTTKESCPRSAASFRRSDRRWIPRTRSSLRQIAHRSRQGRAGHASTPQCERLGGRCHKGLSRISLERFHLLFHAHVLNISLSERRFSALLHEGPRHDLLACQKTTLVRSGAAGDAAGLRADGRAHFS